MEEAERQALPADGQKATLSRRQAAAIWVNQLYQGVQIGLPYTLAVFIVRHFEATRSEAQIGQLTGILAATFSAAQVCTSYFWGVFMDTWGRKPVILISNVMTGIAALGLGLSGSYGAAISCRIVGGLFNGSGVAVKTMLGESCSSTEQAKGMAVLSLGWGMGSVLGPMLGGALTFPCDNYSGFPLCSPGALFSARPFLLPCMATVVIGILATISNAIWLQETLQRLRMQKAPDELQRQASGEARPMWRRLAAAPSNLRALLKGYSSLSYSAGDDEPPAQTDELHAYREEPHISRVSQDMELASRLSASLPRQEGGADSTAAQHGNPSQRPHAHHASHHHGAAGERADAFAHKPWQQAEALAPGSLAAIHAKRGTTLAGHSPTPTHDGSALPNGTPFRGLADAPATPRAPASPLRLNNAASVLEWMDSLPGSRRCSLERLGSLTLPADVSTPFPLPAQAAGLSVPHSRQASATLRSSVAGSEAGTSDGGEQEREGLLPWQGGAPASKQEGQLPPDSFSRGPSDSKWWRERQLQICFAGYGSTTFLFNVMDELAPLFASAPRSSGGLGLRTDQLAWPLSISGAVLVFFALVVYPRLQARIGVLAAVKLGMTLAVPVIMLVPCASFPSRAIWEQASLTGALALRTMAGTACMTSSMIMINLCAPPLHLGAVNGAGNTIAALMRALGPFLCGNVWALTVHLGVKGQQFLPFALVSVAMLSTRLLYMLVHLPAFEF